MRCLQRHCHYHPVATCSRLRDYIQFVLPAAQSLPGRQCCLQATARVPLQPSLRPSASCSAHKAHSLTRPAIVMASLSGADQSGASPTDPIVQYVILRSDLWQELKWPLGSIAAQACHAAVAAIWLTQDQEHTVQYCSPGQLDHMHKVVLEIKSEAKLQELAAKLAQDRVPHKLWMEQPENMPTCLALAPLPKSQAHPYVKRLKLCKGS